MSVWDDEKMPMTKDGVRADIIMDPSSLPSRANVGRVYEQYFNGASRKLRSIVRAEKDDKKAWQHVMSFLEAYGTEQEAYYKNANAKERDEILKEIREREFYLHYRVSSSKRAWEIVNDLEKTIYKPLVDTISLHYRGEHIETKKPAMIAPIYTYLLCKIPDESLITCSIPRFNHYMIAIGASSSQKHTRHVSHNPLKIFGETENRMLIAVAGPMAALEIKDRNCSIPTLKNIIDTFLTADKPTYTDKLVDRSKVKFGEDSALQLVKHIFSVAGIGIKYEKDPNYNFDVNMLPGIGLKRFK